MILRIPIDRFGERPSIGFLAGEMSALDDRGLRDLRPILCLLYRSECRALIGVTTQSNSASKNFFAVGAFPLCYGSHG